MLTGEWTSSTEYEQSSLNEIRQALWLYHFLMITGLKNLQQFNREQSYLVVKVGKFKTVFLSAFERISFQ